MIRLRQFATIIRSRRARDVALTRIRVLYWRCLCGIDIRLGKGCVFRTRWLYNLDGMEGAITFGEYCTINAGSLRGPIQTGDRVLLNVNCDLSARSESPITIGNDVQIAAYVVIMTWAHEYENVDILIREQPIKFGPVTIEDDVWIATHSVIMPGVTIGRGAVVAANSVVARDVEPYHVVAGVPARPFATRKKIAHG